MQSICRRSRVLAWIASVQLALALALPSPGLTRTIRIETSVPLTDRSDSSIETALRGALDACVRGATAMGMSWIRLHEAVVGADRVTVQVVAGDDDGGDDGEPDEDDGIV